MIELIKKSISNTNQTIIGHIKEIGPYAIIWASFISLCIVTLVAIVKLYVFLNLPIVLCFIFSGLTFALALGYYVNVLSNFIELYDEYKLNKERFWETMKK